MTIVTGMGGANRRGTGGLRGETLHICMKLRDFKLEMQKISLPWEEDTPPIASPILLCFSSLGICPLLSFHTQLTALQ